MSVWRYVENLNHHQPPSSTCNAMCNVMDLHEELIKADLAKLAKLLCFHFHIKVDIFNQATQKLFPYSASSGRSFNEGRFLNP